MNMRKSIGSIRGSIHTWSIVAILGLMVLTPMTVLADSSSPKILPPLGNTYGDLSALWWKWAYSMPIDKHPLLDTADCSEGQSGSVWFLGGNFSAVELAPGNFEGKAIRNCVVPATKALFFPILNVESSKIEGNGNTTTELLAYSEWIMDHAIDMDATIDGVTIQNLQKYHKHSKLFTFGPLPDNNVLQYLGFDAPKGATSISVADGVYLLLLPLPKGDHNIHFSGRFVFSTANGDPFDYNFKLDITYNLKVEPR